MSPFASDICAIIDEAFEETIPKTYVLELLSLLLGDDYTGKRRDGLSINLMHCIDCFIYLSLTWL